MRIPSSLQPLVENGLVDRVLRALKSGKEAQVYLVESQGEIRVAKIYKDADHRSFKNRAAYTEGRQLKKSRDQRAVSKRSNYGRQQDEASWRVAESEVIARLYEAGVRVPRPHIFFEGVLLMEYIHDEHGEPAPRLAEVELRWSQKERIFEDVIQQIVRMLHADIVHGDLSLYNILLSKEGEPVIIDFPQSIDAAANPNAKEILIRDVRSLTRDLLDHQEDHKKLKYGEEMWDIYRRAELEPDTILTGKYVEPEIDVDTANILAEIAFFEEQERKKREALGLESYGKKKRKGAPKPQAEPVAEPTGHEEMERMAKYWETDESASSQEGRRPSRRRGHRASSENQDRHGDERSERRRRGRPRDRQDHNKKK